MFRKLYPWMFLLGGVLIGLVVSGRIRLRAQDRPNPAAVHPVESRDGNLGLPPARGEPVDLPEVAAPSGAVPARPGTASVQDVLLRTYRFAFDRPTSLSRVCLQLKQTLGVPVVLDIAALERQDVKPEDTVQLELDGVRLKTGLKLLLDQVGLTYRVVAEDNLLILTDREGSDDPLDRIWTELRNLHRDVHEVQDALDDLTDSLYGEVVEEGPRVRKPTIIEEKPEADPPAFEPPAGDPSRTPKGHDQVPSGPGAPNRSRGVRPTPSRVPLSGPRHPL